MKKKKIIFILFFIIAIIILITCSISTEIENNVENIEEIQPEPEISEEEIRQTTVNLYFEDKTSGVLAKEERKIDSKNLIDNPYKYVLELLLDGPENEDLNNPIPEGTKLNDIKFEKGIIYIDLSKEFLNANGTNAIYSVVNTLSEFTEVTGIKYTIDGKNEEKLKDIFINS